MYDFDRPLNRIGTNSSKWDGSIAKYGREDIIPMPVADMDFYCLPEIQEAIVRRAAHPTFGYTVMSSEFYESIIKWYKRRHDFDVERREILPALCVLSGVRAGLLSTVKPGDGVLLTTPSYHPFFDMIEGVGGRTVSTALVEKNGHYEINWEDFEAKVKQCSAYILCSPHNPVGRVWKKEELKRMIDICVENGVYVITDEIHSDLVFSGHKHYTAYQAADPEQYKYIVICAAPSKTFNIAGLCVSYVIVKDQELRRKVEYHLGCTKTSKVNMLAMEACIAAYTYGDKWVDELNEYLEANCKHIVDFFAEKLPKVKTVRNEGTYLMLLDFSAYTEDQDELERRIVEGAGVCFNNGNMFRPGRTGYFRMNFGCQRATLDAALERLYNEFKD